MIGRIGCRFATVSITLDVSDQPEINATSPSVLVFTRDGSEISRATLTQTTEDAKKFTGELRLSEIFSPGAYEIAASVGDNDASASLYVVVRYFEKHFAAFSEALELRRLAAQAREKDDLPETVKHLRRAAILYERANCKAAAASVLVDLGAAYLTKEEYSAALDNSRRALNFYRDIDDIIGIDGSFDQLEYISNALRAT
jgi:hypothetical protein